MTCANLWVAISRDKDSDRVTKSEFPSTAAWLVRTTVALTCCCDIYIGHTSDAARATANNKHVWPCSAWPCISRSTRTGSFSAIDNCLIGLVVVTGMHDCGSTILSLNVWFAPCPAYTTSMTWCGPQSVHTAELVRRPWTQYTLHKAYISCRPASAWHSKSTRTHSWR